MGGRGGRDKHSKGSGPKCAAKSAGAGNIKKHVQRHITEVNIDSKPMLCQVQLQAVTIIKSSMPVAHRTCRSHACHSHTCHNRICHSPGGCSHICRSRTCHSRSCHSWSCIQSGKGSSTISDLHPEGCCSMTCSHSHAQKLQTTGITQHQQGNCHWHLEAGAPVPYTIINTIPPSWCHSVAESSRKPVACVVDAFLLVAADAEHPTTSTH